jgi:hypothetical protein
MKGQGDGRAGDRLRGVESKGQTDQTKSGLKDAGEKIRTRFQGLRRFTNH